MPNTDDSEKLYRSAGPAFFVNVPEYQQFSRFLLYLSKIVFKTKMFINKNSNNPLIINIYFVVVAMWKLDQQKLKIVQPKFF